MFFFTPMVVNLLGFKINSVDNSSVINAGPVQSIDQFTAYKRNQAFGELNGDLSPTTLPITAIVDPDVSDSPAVKNSVI
ncbi:MULTISPECIES: spore germination protein [Heyndrickxia]|uniref:Spore germination protein n=1 Tax=Heyndrickxia vini TaxID=1476025 RepID=A0ABX7E3A0_9BACI|nr:spore germination protein [Heyndrickxia vini]QQZ09754.1 spore germination protein [Heyndrickxia vini]